MENYEDALAVYKNYQNGRFWGSPGEDSPNYVWHTPQTNRTLLPILDLKIRSSLRREFNKRNYEITFNQDFRKVIEACAETHHDDPEKIQKKREKTWLSDYIRNISYKLNDLNLAQSIEFRRDGELLGGIYGISLYGTFSAQSMFSKVSYASQIALIHLCARLSMAGHTMLDVQRTNDHLIQFGAYEIPQENYLAQLRQTRGMNPNIYLDGVPEDDILAEYLQKREHQKAAPPQSSKIPPDDFTP